MNRAQAMERIKARRSRAEYQANHRRSQLMEGDAVCRRLMEERAQAGQNALERIQSGEGAEVSAQRILELGRKLEARVRELLKERGLGSDFLAPSYTCPICKDTGLRPDRSPCSCLCTLMMEGRPSGVDRETDFSAYDERLIPAGEQRENTRKLRDDLIAYAKGFRPGCGNLLIRGAAGLGKSFLLGCTATAINRRGYSVMYLTAYDLLERFRQKHIAGEYTLPPIMGADFLVIDDLGTEPMLKNISIEYLMAVLNHRSAKKLPYAVATNLTMAQLMERYGERIVSRLLDRARLVQLTGQDLRLAALRGNA